MYQLINVRYLCGWILRKKSISFYYVNINLNILNIEKCLTLIQNQSKNNLVGKKDFFFWFKFKNNYLVCSCFCAIS